MTALYCVITLVVAVIVIGLIFKLFKKVAALGCTGLLLLLFAIWVYLFLFNGGGLA